MAKKDTINPDAKEAVTTSSVTPPASPDDHGKEQKTRLVSDEALNLFLNQLDDLIFTHAKQHAESEGVNINTAAGFRRFEVYKQKFTFYLTFRAPRLRRKEGDKRERRDNPKRNKSPNKR